MSTSGVQVKNMEKMMIWHRLVPIKERKWSRVINMIQEVEGEGMEATQEQLRRS